MKKGQLTSAKPELALLLECSRTIVEEAGAARIRSLAASDLNWAYVLALAEEQGVAPLLELHLRAHAGASVPSEWLARLQELCEGNTFINLSMAAELFRVIEILRGREIQAIPYKGPVLAEQAYGDIGLRIFSDLDLVVRHRDVMRACEILVTAGYEADFPMSEAASGKVPGQYVFRREGSRVGVELHTERSLRYFPRRLDLDAMAERLESVTVGGREILTFAVEDMFPLLCVHGSKHFWDRLLWIADIAALIARRQNLDWKKVFTEARALGAERMVLLGICLAERMLGARLPPDVVGRVRGDRAACSLAEEIRVRYLREDRATPAVFERAKFRIRMRGNILHGLTYFLKLATAPTEEDWGGASRGAASRMQGALRPLRLLRKYGLGVRRQPTADLARYLPVQGWLAEQMLELAGVTHEDVLYDLGCGDGEIVVLAAKRYGARCVGIEIDGRRLSLARARASAEGVDSLVKFIERDAKTVDLSAATVVALYVGAVGNARLARQLRSQLRPGARIVSGDGDIPGWPPFSVQTVRGPRGESGEIFLWKIETAGKIITVEEPKRQASS